MLYTDSLKKNYSFRTVYNKGKSIANRTLVMYILKNGTNTNQLGISVSKKVGNSVVRSRVTRLIRESYRLFEKNIMPGFDIVFIARVSSKDSTYADFSAAMQNLVKKHGILRSANEDA